MGCCYSDGRQQGIESKTRMQMGAEQYSQVDQYNDGMTELSMTAVVVPQDEVNKAECLRI